MSFINAECEYFSTKWLKVHKIGTLLNVIIEEENFGYEI